MPVCVVQLKNWQCSRMIKRVLTISGSSATVSYVVPSNPVVCSNWNPAHCSAARLSLPLTTSRRPISTSGFSTTFRISESRSSSSVYWFDLISWATRLKYFMFSEGEAQIHYIADDNYPTKLEIQQPLPEWSNRRGSESSTLETVVYVWRYTLLVLHVRQEEEEGIVMTAHTVTTCVKSVHKLNSRVYCLFGGLLPRVWFLAIIIALYGKIVKKDSTTKCTVSVQALRAQQELQCKSKKSPPAVFGHFFLNGWEFLINFLHTYYTFISTLDCKYLFSYLQFWWSYAILSETTHRIFDISLELNL